MLSLSVTMAALLPISASMAQETISDSRSVAVTVYNQDFGLVKDIRNVKLNQGINVIRMEDVAARIDPTSISIQSLTAPNSILVREQNYQYDIINPQTILSKSVGKSVRFRHYLETGSVTELSGVLLNSPRVTVADASGPYAQYTTREQGLVVQTDSGVVLNPSGEIHLPSLPPGLVPKPSLLWKLEASKAGEHKAEIAYQTAGLNWKCDYVSILNKDDNMVDLTSWVTLDNKSGAAYKNASLKLIAGDVHRVQPQHDFIRPMDAMSEGVRAAAPQFEQKPFAEYHLYSLQGQTDLMDNETKQMSLFNASQIPVRKLFVFDAERSPHFTTGNTNSRKVQVKIEAMNSQKNNLGMPMPKGKVRVYKKDHDGALQFIGEDLIDHTPVDEKVRLYIGDAFDLVAERKQTNFQSKVLASGSPAKERNVQTMSYEVSLRNHKNSEVTITTIDRSWGDWTILRSSHPYKKTDSRTFEFETKVPANGETKITYDIEVRY